MRYKMGTLSISALTFNGLLKKAQLRRCTLHFLVQRISMIYASAGARVRLASETFLNSPTPVVLSGLCVLVLLSGCGDQETKALEQVERADPAFLRVVEERHAVDKQITALEEELQTTRATVKAKMGALKDTLEAEERTVHERIRLLEDQLDPVREALAVEEGELKGALKEARARVKRVRRQVKDLNGIIDREREAGQVVEEWIEQLRHAEHDRADAKAALSDVRQALKILRVKISLLKQ